MKPDGTSFRPLSRRHVLKAGAAVAALSGAPSQLWARPDITAIEDRLARLAGFEVLPRDLMNALMDRLDPDAASRLEGSGPLPDALRQRLLTALYTGLLPAAEEDAPSERIGFSNALMWATIEETNNVISYCGGLPGYWSEPPETP